MKRLENSILNYLSFVGTGFVKVNAQPVRWKILRDRRICANLNLGYSGWRVTG